MSNCLSRRHCIDGLCEALGKYNIRNGDSFILIWGATPRALVSDTVCFFCLGVVCFEESGVCVWDVVLICDEFQVCV